MNAGQWTWKGWGEGWMEQRDQNSRNTTSGSLLQHFPRHRQLLHVIVSIGPVTQIPTVGDPDWTTRPFRDAVMLWLALRRTRRRHRTRLDQDGSAGGREAQNKFQAKGTAVLARLYRRGIGRRLGHGKNHSL